MAKKSNKKIFVLDTSVILHNHSSILSFQDNDIVIPITVLEELDRFKKGHENKNYEAREFTRIMDRLSEKSKLNEWVPLGEDRGNIKVQMDEHRSKGDAVRIFGADKGDHRILNAALIVAKENPNKKVVLVSKDFNLRIKARAVNLEAEDYKTGKIENIDKLYDGKETIEDFNPELIDKLYSKREITPKEAGIKEIIPNQYYNLKSPQRSALAYMNPVTNMIELVEKNTVMQITPRNAEQAFALHAILNDNVKLVTLQGIAGTGKTLLALAAALEQRSNFKQIYLSRPIVPLSNKDLGFLPGDAKDKIGPYMQPLYDNLKFIKHQYSDHSNTFNKIDQLLENEKLIIEPLAYIRGRSISDVCFIVDEAQNLTPHEVKTIITRAGENTKIIFTGDIHQIDTPYLDTQSNGLSYLIDKIKHHPLFAHVKLEKGERSELANLANEKL